MEIIRAASELKARLAALRKAGKIIGFVPTMGALHEGHLSLVKEAADHSDVVVMSIFVNPNQFNNASDLERYPRDLQKDAALLEGTACELLFVPSVKEVYPEPDQRVFDFGDLDKVMEGKFRPGHFNGVAQVVSRLFDLVAPHKAFFGEKDFQQLAVVRAMVRQLNYPVEIVPCPIVREADGLAMSSRNMLLSTLQRKNAPQIALTLSESCNFAATHSVAETKQQVVDAINAVPELEVEYFEIVDGNSLQAVGSWEESSYVVGCIAVFAGEVRLIDNVIYKNSMS
ncbi:MAG TPA: pantoate--beta-alanine ligase [Bacteroidales bacterium]|jgi:pantoate--beta-alanine ligase|nr:pantoate--beta-alanine ligase [Bacteroidales bacterium]